MPDEIAFNKELKLDLLFLMVDGKQCPTLTIVDKALLSEKHHLSHQQVRKQSGTQS
jgi:hypothetical protein